MYSALFFKKIIRKIPKAYRYYRTHGLRRTIFRIRQELFNHVQIKMASEGYVNFLDRYTDRPLKKNLYSPLVSVIVPNYNHALFLRKRLDSIYFQTYTNFEVILLDDCSSDNSVSILEKYKHKFSNNTSLYVNEQHSGSMFRQWSKGIKLAKGELIFIAESDSGCKRNFLEKLVPFFCNSLVSLAYSDIHFLKAGKKVNALTKYMEKLNMNWGKNFIFSPHTYIESYLSIKNTIPNISGVLFRKKFLNPILDDESWLSLHLHGDWIFYLNQLKSGFIAFTNETLAYCRVHDDSALAIRQTPSYYGEYEKVAEYLAENFRLNDISFNKMYMRLKNESFEPDYIDTGHVGNVFSLKKALKLKKERKLHIIIAGFAFIAGGSETFSIMLANGLYERGYTITFLTFNYEPENSSIRAFLHQDIPVINFTEFNMSISEIVNSLSADIIHSHHSSIDFMISKEKHLMPMCKHVVTMHGAYEGMDKHESEYILKREIKFVDLWIYTADKNLPPIKAYENRLKGRLFRIPNALPSSSATPVSRKELGLSEDDFILCLVSRAVPEKGWQEAVDAVTIANKKSLRKIHLIMIGEGWMYNKLKKHDIPNVHLLGFKENIRDFFAMSDMGFLPSRDPGESFPLVVIDCLLSGRPVLATNNGEIPYQLSAGGNSFAGELISLDNASIPIPILAERIVSIADSQELYDGMLSRVPAAAEKFNFNAMFDSYCNCYDEAVKVDSFL